MAHIDDPHTQKANMKYIRAAMNAPMLEKDHELALATRWREDRDEKALHELVSSYTRLVVSMATKFRNYGLPMGDLIQEGNIGLMQAAERFEPSRELRFSTYASWWIRSSIQDYVLRNWSIVRTGTTAAQKSLFFNFRRLRNKIENRNESEGLNDSDRSEIAEELNVRVKDVETMEGRLSGVDSSLNMRVGEDGDEEWQNFLPAEQPDPEQATIGVHDAQTRSEWLDKALSTLPDREQQIIRERHLGYETVTLEELGKDLGISKERVRQLEQRAMIRLKDSMSKMIGNPADMFNAA